MRAFVSWSLCPTFPFDAASLRFGTTARGEFQLSILLEPVVDNKLGTHVFEMEASNFAECQKASTNTCRVLFLEFLRLVKIVRCNISSMTPVVSSREWQAATLHLQCVACTSRMFDVPHHKTCFMAVPL